MVMPCHRGNSNRQGTGGKKKEKEKNVRLNGIMKARKEGAEEEALSASEKGGRAYGWRGSALDCLFVVSFVMSGNEA